MKNFSLIIDIPFVTQILNNNNADLPFVYIEYMLLFFLFSLATIIMMLIPVILFYSMVVNFIDLTEYNSKIDREMCCQDNHSNYLNSICSKYFKSFSNFFKNFLALTAWNVFSLGYIIIGFDSFSNGLREYFYFPFAVLQSLSKNEIYNTIYKFQSNWSSMLAIIILTFSFYFLGKYIGSYVAKNMIKKRRLELGTS